MKNQIRTTLQYLYISFFLFLICTVPVSAYIDPSVMTYTIQAIAGVAIAIGAFISIYWRKFSRYLQNKYHISLSKKEIESDELYLFDENIDKERIIPVINSVTKEEVKVEQPKYSFTPAILLAVASSFMLMVYAPLDLYFNNVSEFWFDYKVILPIFLVMFLIFLAGLLVVLLLAYLINKKLYIWVLLIGLVTYLVFYIHGNFMIGALPVMDGETVIWSNYYRWYVISAIVIVVVFAICFMLYKKLQTNGFQKLVSFTSILISLMLLITSISVGIKNYGFRDKDFYLYTEKDIMTMSEDANYLILILDTVDAGLVRDMWDEHPEYEKAFEDFTWFENTVSGYPFTKYSIPLSLTGKWYTYQEDYQKFLRHEVPQSPLFKKLSSEDYLMSFYEDDVNYNYVEFQPLFDNFDERSLSRENVNFAKYEMFLTFYRYAPYFLKRYVPNNASILNYIGQEVSKNGEKRFMWGNRYFYDHLVEEDYQYVPDKLFKIIHLEGAHPPLVWNKDVEVIGEENGTAKSNAEAAMTIACTFVNKLRETNVYDNTAIVVMSDHGFKYKDSYDNEYVSRNHPILFVKGFNEKHEFKVDQAPISQEDYLEAFLRLSDSKQSDSIFDYHEGDKRERRYFRYNGHSGVDLEMTEFVQSGYANQEDTAVPTGVKYVLDPEICTPTGP